MDSNPFRSNDAGVPRWAAPWAAAWAPVPRTRAPAAVTEATPGTVRTLRRPQSAVSLNVSPRGVLAALRSAIDLTVLELSKRF